MLNRSISSFFVAAGAIICAATWNPPASAQSAVTTIGASDAALCYEDARASVTQSTEHCDDALEDGLIERDHVATLVNRGIILNRAGRYSAAIADFDAALKRDGRLAEAWLNRGNSMLLTRRADDAIFDYERALEFGLRQAHLAWYNIGLAHEAKGDAAKARGAYAKSIEIAPGFELARRKLAEA